jgi:O-antigen ligase
MRVYALYALVAGLCVYAWRNWFYSLCGLIVMMAFIQNEDMPKTIGGVQGLNLWNVLMFFVILAWATQRRKEGLTWDMPKIVAVLLVLYVGVILVGWGRMMVDRSHLETESTGSLISEELINTIKWIIPGLLLFDGCRSRQRVVVAMVCLLVLYSALALQLAHHMPMECATGGQNKAVHHIRLKISQEVGYSADDFSTMLAGASWAMVACVPLFLKKWQKGLVIGGTLLVAYGQALTGGRAGYVAWGAVGLILCAIKWRKYLLLAPVAPFALYVIFPAAAERMLQGFGAQDVSGETVVDAYEVTSGRSLAWPMVIEKIGESPALGYGRKAMTRTGLTEAIDVQYPGESFPHPHNAYLEWTLDNGFVGLVPLLCFLIVTIFCSVQLFRDSDPVLSAAGGVALALLLAQLIGGMGSQHFYSRESTLGLWAAILLMFRVHVERKRALSRAPGLGAPVRPSWSYRRLPVTR